MNQANQPTQANKKGRDKQQVQQAPSQQQSYPQIGYLSNEDFDKLKRSIQLLRISQIRYIVQKYDLPANGNKGKLLKIILGLLDTLRPTQLLVQICMDVNRLLATQNEPFTNPLDESINKMELTVHDQSFNIAANPFVRSIDKPPLLGPLLAPPGRNSCNIVIEEIPQLHGHAMIQFACPGNELAPFELSCSINGIPIYVLPDDPKPGPIDITDIVSKSKQLIFNISLLKNSVPMEVIISDVEIVTVNTIAEELMKSKGLQCSVEEILARGSSCPHPDRFSLIKFLSSGLAKGKLTCPLCGNELKLEDLFLSVLSQNMN